MYLIYPFSQYIRHAGGREGDTSQRIEVIAGVLKDMAFDPSFRNGIVSQIQSSSKFDAYLPIASGPLGRFAMVAEADRLIASTSIHTEWETIEWGFSMLVPRFLNPDKPYYAANNYLGHITGELWQYDESTQISYGFMANFYNAFGYSGVFLGGFLLVATLYYWLRIFFGNPEGASIWLVVVIGYYHHALVEQSVSGLIVTLWFPIIVLLLLIGAKLLAPFMPKRRA